MVHGRDASKAELPEGRQHAIGVELLEDQGHAPPERFGERPQRRQVEVIGMLVGDEEVRDLREPRVDDARRGFGQEFPGVVEGRPS